MQVNLTLTWEKAPAEGHIGIEGGQIANVLIVNGTGSMDAKTQTFQFSSLDEMCRLAIAVDLESDGPATFYVDECEKPIRADIASALDREITFAEQGATLAAETDIWAPL